MAEQTEATTRDTEAGPGGRRAALEAIRTAVATTGPDDESWRDFVAVLHAAEDAYEGRDAETFDALIEWFDTPPEEREGGYTPADILETRDLEQLLYYRTSDGRTALRVTGPQDSVLITPGEGIWQLTSLDGTVYSRHGAGDEQVPADALAAAAEHTGAPLATGTARDATMKAIWQSLHDTHTTDRPSWRDDIAVAYAAEYAREIGDDLFDVLAEWFDTPPEEREGGYTAADVLADVLPGDADLDLYITGTPENTTSYRVTGAQRAVLVTSSSDGWHATGIGEADTVEATYPLNDEGRALAFRDAVDRTGAHIPSSFTTVPSEVMKARLIRGTDVTAARRGVVDDLNYYSSDKLITTRGDIVIRPSQETMFDPVPRWEVLRRVNPEGAERYSPEDFPIPIAWRSAAGESLIEQTDQHDTDISHLYEQAADDVPGAYVLDLIAVPDQRGYDGNRAIGRDAPQDDVATEARTPQSDTEPAAAKPAVQEERTTGLEPNHDGEDSRNHGENSAGVRRDGPEALGDVSTEPVREDHRRGPGELLLGDRTGGGGSSRARHGGEPVADAPAAGQPGDGGAQGGDGDGASRGGSAGRAGVPATGAGHGEPAGPDQPAQGGGQPAQVAPVRYEPRGQQDLAARDQRQRARDAVAALQMLRQLQETGAEYATPDQQAVLARWAGMGNLREAFTKSNTDPFWREIHDDLRPLVNDSEWDALYKNSRNAHYTDAGYVDAIWAGLRDLGFEGGRVLEPGSGTGNFIGRAPADAHVTGVEIESITASISAYLYPDADIRQESFGATPLEVGSFDAVVGNVPFGAFPVFDRRFNPTNSKLIHDLFLEKSVAALKPGGVMIALTSAGTLDKQDSTTRQALYRQADLLGAVRLPNGAHHATAGTQVLTDILVLRKRDDGEELGDATWLGVSKALHPDGSPVTGMSRNGREREYSINDYFTAHEDMLLGQLVDGGFDHIGVQGDLDTLTDDIRTTLSQIADTAREDGRTAALERATIEPFPEAETGKKVDVVPPEGTSGPNRKPAPSALTAAREPIPGQIIHTGTFQRARSKSFAPKDIDDEIKGLRQNGQTAEAEALRKLFTSRDMHTFARLDRFGNEVELNVPSTQTDELARMLRLRDLRQDLLDLEKTTEQDTPEMDQIREALNTEYDDYVARYGPLNRQKTTFKEVPEPEDPENVPGDIVQRDDGTWAKASTRRDRMGGIRQDPTWWAIAGLEKEYTEDPTGATKGRAVRSDLFTTRQMSPAPRQERIEDVDDALLLSMERTGVIDLAHIANLLGVGQDDVREVLGARVVDDPQTGELVTYRQYTSGNVRAKLAAATEAAERDPKYAQNVDLLTAVVPADKDVDQIIVRLGTPWVSAEVHSKFLCYLTDTRNATIRKEMTEHGTNKWKVNSGGGTPGRIGGDYMSVPLGHDGPLLAEFGTSRMDTYELVRAGLRQQPVTVWDERVDSDGRSYRVVNKEESDAANRMAEKIQREFGKWLWSDSERAQEHKKRFNDQYRSHAEPNFVDSPKRFYEGMSSAIELDPHQNDAVTRALETPAVLLHHEVGTGKTFTTAATLMELRRLGRVDTPLVAVPNHMVEQTVREYKQLYPDMRILTIDGGTLEKKKKTDDPHLRLRSVAAQVREGDWDAVVVSHSALRQIPMDQRELAGQLESGLEDLQERREFARQAGDTQQFNQLTDQIERERARHDKLIDEADSGNGFDFASMGFDYIAVDEAHLFKNDRIITSTGMDQAKPSKMAEDLRYKIESIRQRNEAAGKRNHVLLATGTPVSNSSREWFVMQRFLRPDLLREAGVADFDNFAAMFLRMRETIETDVAGNLKVKIREGDELENAGEMKRLMSQSFDQVTAADVGLERPRIQGGSASAVNQPASENQRLFTANLQHRYNTMPRGKKLPPGSDNALAIGQDGLAAAIDLRLLDESKLIRAGIDPTTVGDEDSKLPELTDSILNEWRRTKDTRFRVRKPKPGEEVPWSDTPGGLQIVFADKGVPNSAYSFYDVLKDRLVEGGMHPDEIAFIHDAGDDPVRMRKLTDRARHGQIKVLIGSTPKMGTGLNVQNRATVLHHVDSNYRPDMIEQRNGRIMRRGNQNDDVAIRYYVREGTTEGFQWGHVARKDNFLRQYDQASLDATRLGNNTGPVLSEADQYRALATGDPYLLESFALNKKVDDLEAEADQHASSVDFHQQNIQAARVTAEREARRADRLDTVLGKMTDTTSGENFRFTTGGQTYTKPAEAAEALADQLQSLKAEQRYITGDGTWRSVGQFGGLDIAARTGSNLDGARSVQFGVLDGAGGSREPTLPRVKAKLNDNVAISQGTFRRLENMLGQIQPARDQYREGERMSLEESARSAELSTATFERADELAALQEQQSSLRHLMKTIAGNHGEASNADEHAQLVEQAKERYAEHKAIAEAAEAASAGGEMHKPVEMGTERRTRRSELVRQAREIRIRLAASGTRLNVDTSRRLREEDATQDTAGVERSVRGAARRRAERSASITASSDAANVNPAQQTDTDPEILEEIRRLQQIANPVRPGSGQSTVHARPQVAEPTAGGTDRDAAGGR